MYALRKIKEIKGYRFFQDFHWNENGCDLFSQNNLIYGWNGSGKTTLCDFMYGLETGSFSEDNISFSLLFEDTATQAHTSITQGRMNTLPYRFRVFHQNYIQENIAVDNVKHIFSVGREQIEKVNEVKRLRSTLGEKKDKAQKAEIELRDLEKEFDRIKTAKAKIIKDAAQYSNSYNKNKYYSAHQRLTKKMMLTEAEYQAALSAIRAERRPDVPLFKVGFIQSSVREYICDILIQTPVNNTIDALKKDTQLSNWVENGLSLHQGRNTSKCLFCGGPISETRFNQLRDHFNKSYKDLCDKIDGAVGLLGQKMQQFDAAKIQMPNCALLYPELQKQYMPLQTEAIVICEHYSKIISDIIDVLYKKKSDMINDGYVNEFLQLVDQLSFDYSIFDALLEILQKHNQKNKEFNKSIEQAQAKIEYHHISEFSDEINSFEKSIYAKAQEKNNLYRDFLNHKAQIDSLEQEVKNSQIPADEINRDIAFIMGRSELVFTNSDLGYKITRNGKKAKNLSKGEENAIALVYFFNTLLDVDADAGNSIIVLDDPISSFDSNFYYNAISYIRDKTKLVGQTFVFTHKFALQKDFSLMFREKTNRYTISRNVGMPQIINEDKLISQYHDEYAYLFKKVYDFVKQPPNDTSEYLQYPNIARRLLESFLTFKLPLPNDQCSMLDKVMELERENNTYAGRAIMRLLNNRSHLRVISSNEHEDDIDSISVLPDTLKHLLEFMKHHDAIHYNTLARLADPQYSEEGAAVEVIRPVYRQVNYYEMSASAGLGNFLGSDFAGTKMEVTNPECTFAVKISGDSMEPNIHDQDIALVKQCEVIPNARIGIVNYKGVCYCKKIVQKSSGILLVSLNKNYPPITVSELDEYHPFGEVIEIIHHSDSI